jgi:hypothetical protein
LYESATTNTCDFRFRLFGREWFIPLTSSVVLSLLAMLVAKFL